MVNLHRPNSILIVIIVIHVKVVLFSGHGVIRFSGLRNDFLFLFFFCFRQQMRSKRPKGDAKVRKVREAQPDSPSEAAVSSPVAAVKESAITDVSLSVRWKSSVPANQCRLLASEFRRLQMDTGSIVCVSFGDYSMYVEAWMSTDAVKGTIELCSDITAASDARTVTVSKLKESLPDARVATLRISFCPTDGSEEWSGGSVYWTSLFRHRFYQQVIYNGMKCSLQTSLCTATVEVVTLTSSTEQQIDAGMVSMQTQLVALQAVLNSELELATSIKSQDRVLYVGPSGCGKTKTLSEFASCHRAAGRHVFSVDADQLLKSDDNGLSTRLRLHELFMRSRASAPSTIVVDDLDLICSASSSSVGSMWAVTLVSRGLAEEIHAVMKSKDDVCFLASASSVDSIHPSLLGEGAIGLGNVKVLKIPETLDEKVKCLQRCLLDFNGTGGVSEEQCRSAVASLNGYSQRDFSHLVDLATTLSFEKRCTLQCSDEELLIAARQVQPSALREFDISIPDVTWGDIGGSEEAKGVLKDLVQWALGKQNHLFAKYRLTPPRGVLLYGPPGCSKTMLAKALANESRLNFISVKGPEVFSKWVGDSEKAVRNIFSRARAASPCVVFIDELDGMCGHRGQGGVSDRVISQFLTELDGLPSALSTKDYSLVFVAATNRPDNIDGAVLRPGRIDKLVYVGLPSEEERKCIAEIQLRRVPAAEDVTPSFVASLTEGYSGAEVVAVVKEAAFHALDVSIQSECITRDNIMASIKKIVPRTKSEDVEWYQRWRHDGAHRH